MVDRFSPEKRRKIMAAIKSKNTLPELGVRSLLHKMGYRFCLHDKDLPGKPDIVLPRHKKAIFVHGCFWHGHKNCRRASRPSSNLNFWNKKIDGNLKRDSNTKKEIKFLGWKVLIIWQCQISNEQKLITRLKKFLKN